VNIVVLTGGVGGVKLVLGLAHARPHCRLTAIVNTGDDFRHLGLAVSPDIDTLLYALSGQANAEQGWGREGESWSFMAALRRLGGPDWFQLGDGDLAVHVMRSARLAAGETLSAITADMASRWGIAAEVLPMSDDRVATMVQTDDGLLGFQDYFVARRCVPVVRAIAFEGAREARPAPGVEHAIATADMILVAPSNPYLSVDPILAVPGIRAALACCAAPLVAVSPLVGGTAVKGPTAKLMDELGIAVTARSVARHYAPLLDAMLVDERDPVEDIGVREHRTNTLMHGLDDRIRVAEAVLALGEACLA
jgi:LPPG:FO 2-phospho-L-lactate transferase